MTINVAVVTGEALVLGCDSIASTTKHLLDPFKYTPTDMGNGKHSIEFSYDELVPHVSGAWGGVTKMFPLHTQGACVAAITAGLARLNDRALSSLASEFMIKQHNLARQRVNVEAIANDFLRFIDKEYNRHYQGSSIPQTFWDGPEFLIGGYGRDDHHPSLYRVNIQNNSIECLYTSGSYGAAWAGQSDAVERLIMGYDYPLRFYVEREAQMAIDEMYDSTSQALARILQNVIDELGVELPANVDTSLPDKKALVLPWDSVELPISCKNLPLQDAIDFAAFLVNMQSGRAKFVSGVATVGGRTHVAILTKEHGFKMINEPELVHRNIGFSDGL